MSRLTKLSRDRMVRDLLKHRFNGELEALGARSAELFAAVYEDHYDTETRRLMAKLKARYRDAFEHRTNICCRVNGLKISLGAVRIGTEQCHFVKTVTSKPFVRLDTESSNWSYLDCEIGSAVAEFAESQVALSAKITTAHRDLSGALAGITTDKQLSEQWPEALPIIGKHIPVATGSNLPAVQFSKLTAEFSLVAQGGAQ